MGMAEGSLGERSRSGLQASRRRLLGVEGCVSARLSPFRWHIKADRRHCATSTRATR
jgi:hypothetical protein